MDKTTKNLLMIVLLVITIILLQVWQRGSLKKFKKEELIIKRRIKLPNKKLVIDRRKKMQTIKVIFVSVFYLDFILLYFLLAVIDGLDFSSAILGVLLSVPIIALWINSISGIIPYIIEIDQKKIKYKHFLYTLGKEKEILIDAIESVKITNTLVKRLQICKNNKENVFISIRGLSKKDVDDLTKVFE